MPEPWPVAVFAHNEEETIVDALDALRPSDSGHAVEFFVLSNGCSDRTDDVVKEYAARRGGVTLVSRQLGDKANAWNLFVHDLGLESDVYFFTDGDVTVTPGALDNLAAELRRNPHAHIASSVPFDARSRETAAGIMTQGRVAGNLYALRGEFVARIRRAGFRMPVGYICDDGLIETLAKWDLDPANKPDKSRVVGCADAAYHVHRWKDVRLYARRLRRYSLRHFQDRMLLHVLRTEGLAAVPAHVNDLYCRHHRMCRVRWRGYHTVFDYWALRRIRAIASSEPSVSSHGPEDQPLAQ